METATATTARPRRTREEWEAIAREALGRAESGTSVMNYAAIFLGFTDRGIPESEIKPRENVFTLRAWNAKGRYVRKGEKGIKICVWTPIDDGRGGTKLVMTNPPVFHISQTEVSKYPVQR